ncbi:hypothetical protein A4H97_06200 [Niastella yeongjuensis]|uniref:Uncharacterized protein n=1 Tax=Niastella yeongjuensis TaxID=354355 RepID=A0A1V9ELT0_9BACT|nr:hypothetical protein A4H97_06200 [Niastella yeongjuensis]
MVYGIKADHSTNGEIIINKGDVIKNPTSSAINRNTMPQSISDIRRLIDKIKMVIATDFAHILTATNKGLTIVLMN